MFDTSTDRAKDTWDLTWGCVMRFRDGISSTKETKEKLVLVLLQQQQQLAAEQSKVAGWLMMVGLCASAKDTVPQLLSPLERQPHLCREKRDTYLMVVIGTTPKSVCSLSPICLLFIQPFHCQHSINQVVPFLCSLLLQHTHEEYCFHFIT